MFLIDQLEQMSSFSGPASQLKSINFMDSHNKTMSGNVE